MKADLYLCPYSSRSRCLPTLTPPKNLPKIQKSKPHQMRLINTIISKKIVTNLIKNGTHISISAATKTSAWKRPSPLVTQAALALRKSVEAYNGKLPTGTVEICSRESAHRSPADPRNHITAVCFDEKGKVKTVHIPAGKTPSGSSCGGRKEGQV
jgi:hypothetical protein